MPTVHQLGRGIRQKKWRRLTAPALAGGPQRLGVVYKVAIMTPRKPNSAKRTFAKIKVLKTSKRIFAKIPGIGEHFLQCHSVVWVRGHGPKDSPGINYNLIRGKADFHRIELYGRRNRRSKFGIKKLR